MNEYTSVDRTVLATVYEALLPKATSFYRNKIPHFVPYEPDSLAAVVVVKLANFVLKFDGENPDDPDIDQKRRERVQFLMLAKSGQSSALRKHPLAKGFLTTTMKNALLDEIRRAQAQGRVSEHIAEQYQILYGEDTHARTDDETERGLVFRDLWSKLQSTFTGEEFAEFFELWEAVHKHGYTGAEISHRYGEAAYKKMFRTRDKVLAAIRDEWPDIYDEFRTSKENNNGRKKAIKRQDH